MGRIRKVLDWFAVNAIGFGVGVLVGRRNGSFAEVDTITASTILLAKGDRLRTTWKAYGDSN